MRFIKTLLLAAALVQGLAQGALAQTAAINGDDYPYCSAVDLSSMSAPPPVVTGPLHMKIPVLSELLKTTTDTNAIVDRLLNVYHPLRAADYDAILSDLVNRILSDNYLDPARLSVIASYPARYQGKIHSREELDRVITRLVQAVGDPNTVYTSAPDRLFVQMRTSFQGIVSFGAYLKKAADGTFVIAALVPGSTADINGFRVGDTILAINGKPLAGLSERDAQLAELFPAGNQIAVLSLQDGKQVRQSYMVQQDVKYKPEGLVFPQGIGYIRLPVSVDSDLTLAAVKAMVGMQQKHPGGLEGFVLDLRYVRDVPTVPFGQLLSFLIDKPIVLHEAKRQADKTVIVTETIQPQSADTSYSQAQMQILHALSSMPLVLLVNGSTSSPDLQEFIQALREGRPDTTVVGESVHGGGVETTVFALPNCGTLAVTTGRYTTARGVPLQSVGITPDVVVLPSRQNTDGDTQLAAAVAVITGKTVTRPANLVANPATTIPSLGTPPKQSAPPDDIDYQRIAHERTTVVLQILVVIALGAAAALYFLIGRPMLVGRSTEDGDKPGGDKPENE